jgi:hypothetical protein
VQPDRTIPNNKLDIIIRDNGKKAHVCWWMLQFQETEMWSRKKLRRP